MARRETDAFMNLTVVLLKKYSKYHTKCDFSAYSQIGTLKQQCEKLMKVPASRQRWFLPGEMDELDDQKKLSDYTISEKDVIHIHDGAV